MFEHRSNKTNNQVRSPYYTLRSSYEPIEKNPYEDIPDEGMGYAGVPDMAYRKEKICSQLSVQPEGLLPIMSCALDRVVYKPTGALDSSGKKIISVICPDDCIFRQNGKIDAAGFAIKQSSQLVPRR